MALLARAGLIVGETGAEKQSSTVKTKAPAATGQKTAQKSAAPVAGKSSTPAPVKGPATVARTGSATATKKGPSTAARSSAARKGSASAQRGGNRGRSNKGSQQSWRSRQLVPTPERYTEIQQALVQKGYLQGPATGKWDQSSTDALRRFQKEQNLEASGKIDSLSLIALGLGPKYDSASAAPPAVPPRPQP